MIFCIDTEEQAHLFCSTLEGTGSQPHHKMDSQSTGGLDWSAVFRRQAGLIAIRFFNGCKLL